MALSKRVRFDVFKRDDFTCQYCGRKTPQVTLEIDHIVPIVEGGGDEPENLATACFDCNRGKGASPLDTKAAVEDLTERTARLREREEQIRAYNEVKTAERERREDEFERVWNYWFSKWQTDSLPKWHTPWENSLRRYLDILGPDEVEDAMDDAAGRFDHVTSNTVKYFIGVCKRKVARNEGRIVACYICGDDLVLEPGSDTSLQWRHSSCEVADG